MQNGAIGGLCPPIAPFLFLPAPRSVTKSHETSIKVISVLSYLRFDIRFPLFFLCATTGWNGCDDSHSTNTQKERKNMNQIILTTPEELRAIVSESVSQTLAGLTLPKNEPDNLTPDAAVGVLEQHGFLISKARLYKLTAKGDVPFRKYGNKLLFSRRELLSWAESLARRVNDKGEAALAIARSANRKLRSHGK